MSTDHAVIEIDYPESDGKPMGESDLHRDWMMRIIQLLKHRYAGQQVYVTGDLLLYYVDGDPRRFVVPDAFVVKGVDPGRRGIYKVWEEGKVPNMVLETTSRSTRAKDTREKPKLYSSLGIPEYFQYDPTGDYLDPPICGYRLSSGRYHKIQPDSLGRLESEELDLWLEVDSNGDLVLPDRATGRILETAEEAAIAACEVERNARVAERAAREVAEAKNRQLEMELAALRAQHRQP